MGFVAPLGVIAIAGMMIRSAVIKIQEADENVARGEYPWSAIVRATTLALLPSLLLWLFLYEQNGRVVERTVDATAAS